MSTDVLKHLQKKMQDEIAVISDDLAMGKAKSLEEYKHSVGVVRGLMVAQSIIADMAERYEEIE